MKKFFVANVAAALLPLALAGSAAAQGQAGKVRVGPLADEQPAAEVPASKGELKKAPTPIGDAKSIKIEKSAEAKNPAKNELKEAARGKSGGAGNGAANPEGKAPGARTDSAANASPEAANGAGKAAKPTPAADNTARRASGAPANSANLKASALGVPVSATPASGGATSDAASKPPPTAAPANTSSAGAPQPAAPKTNNSPPATNAPAGPAAPATGGAAHDNSAANTGGASASAAPPAPTSIYRVGAGDVLDIRLLNQASREQTLYTVMAGGLLEYPLAGDPLAVAGMTPDEIAERLASILRRRAVYTRPQFVISVHEYASHAVLVSGLVADPGTKILRREAVPLYVVIAEAQPQPDAGRAVVISRATGESTIVDLTDTAAMNTLVRAGDVVSVQARPREFLYLGGEVALPGQKDFHPGQTLTQAVLAAGGVTRFSAGKVKVARQGADGRLVTTEYNLKEIEAGQAVDPPLRAGDRVEVVRKR